MTDYFNWTDGEPLGATPANNILGYAANQAQQKITASTTALMTTLSHTYRWMIVRVSAANDVYINTSSTASATSNALSYQEARVIDCGSDGISTLYHLASTGASEIRIWGIYN